MPNLNEALKQKYQKEYQKALLEKWNDHISAVKKVYPGFTDISAINLAIWCENTDSEIKKYQRLHEGTQAADVGPYIRHAFELISGTMPNIVAEEVVSVQALNQKIGQIFWLKYVYGSNKGGVHKGDTAFGPYEINSHEEYTSEHIPQEILSAGGEASVTANLQWGPVIPESVKITVDGNELVDDGEGHITGTGLTAGTIDYTTGAVSLTFASAPVGSVDAEYDYNLEYAPTQAPEFNMEIAEKVVIAKPRRLRTNYAFAAAYDVEKQFGINMDDELLEASVTEIKHEIDQEILNDLYRQAGLSHSWDATPRAAISVEEHYKSFLIALNEAANKIRKASKRVKGNVVVLGINGLTVVESLPGFVPSNAEDKAGAYVAGTIKGQLKVIANPFYDDDAFVVAYKGSNFLDAGYVYAPYLPIFATSVIMLDDFVGRRGYATSYAKCMLNNKYYVKGTITHSTVKDGITIANDEEHPVPTKEVQ